LKTVVVQALHLIIYYYTISKKTVCQMNSKFIVFKKYPLSTWITFYFWQDSEVSIEWMLYYPMRPWERSCERHCLFPQKLKRVALESRIPHVWSKDISYMTSWDETVLNLQDL